MEAPTDSRTLIAREVKAELDNAGWSETAAAAATGIPQTTLNRYLQGHTGMRVDHLWAIADLLDTRPSVILARAEAAA